MIYTKEIIEKITKDYKENNLSVEAIATSIGVPKRSVIAKLSSLGIYKKKAYTNKLGEIPIRKSEYIISLAKNLRLSVEELDSLEKVNKRILQILDKKLSGNIAVQDDQLWM